MKYLPLIFLAILCLAPSYIDQLDGDFNLGTNANTNVTNNSVILANVSGNYTASGTFLSQIFDLGSNPSANISWTYTSPAGTSILVSTRAGNTTLPDASWTGYSSNYASNNGSVLTNGLARYYEYRLQLTTTNGSFTPSVRSVTLAYTEGGPTIAKHSGIVDLDDEYTGVYRFRVEITDTASITNASGRYRINTSGTYSAWTTLSQDAMSYYLDVAEPGTGWANNSAGILQLNVFVEDNSTQSENVTLNETIDAINDAPTLTQLGNNTGIEGILMTRTVLGSDPDGDNVTWSTSHGSITKVSNTQATLSWTPNNLENGLVNVTITMDDGALFGTMTFTANITGTNNAPTLSSISSQTGYFGERITFTVTGNDNDITDNVTFSVRPNFFQIAVVNNGSGNSTTVIGLANFTALTDHRGEVRYTVTISDQQETDSENVTLTIGYCGDNICLATKETASSCPVDCDGSSSLSFVAIDVADRICVNESTVFSTFNASTRYACYYDGRAENSNAFCEPVESVDIDIYRIDNEQRTSIRSISTNSDGNVTWTPTVIGEYKLVGIKEELITGSRIITVQNCVFDINATKRVIEYKKPNIAVGEFPPASRPAQREDPAGIEQQTSLLSIIIWYMLVPLLLAALLYLGTAYYDINKDADPNILKMRLWFWEQRNTYGPVLAKWYQPIKPYADPVVSFIREHIIAPIVWVFKEIRNYIQKIFNR